MKFNMFAASAVLAFCPGSYAAVPGGPIDWITDIRRCSASFAGNGAGSSWQERLTPFAPYSGAADVLVSNGVETWGAQATQESEMNGYGATFEADSEAVLVAGVGSNPLTVQAQAKFDMYFTITDAVEYELSGRVSESFHADSLAVVRLSFSPGATIDEAVSSPDSSRVFHFSGVLQPGTYRLYGEVLGKCRTLPPMVMAQGASSCSLEFEVTPVPNNPPPPVRPKITSSTLAPMRR